MATSKTLGSKAAITALLAASLSSSNLLLSNTAAESTNVITNLSDLPYDENSHLKSHLLVYPGPSYGPCASLVESEINAKRVNLYHHLPTPVEGDAAKAFFGDRLSALSPENAENIHSVTQCPAVCIERGVDDYLVDKPMPDKYFNPDEDPNHGTFADFVASLSCGRVEFGFINYSPKPLRMAWVNPSTGERSNMYVLDRLEKNTKFIHTFVGHRFVVYDQDTNEDFLDHVVEFNGVIGIGNHENKHRHRDIRNEVRSTMRGEWSKHLQVKRTFSALGFDKGRLPDDVFGSMRALYYNNRNPPHRVHEEWDSKGLYVNFWESDCDFIQIPWELKFKWQKRLKDLVEAWVGFELEQTDMYGIRQYSSGARLLTHVDRINTHAASLIVNIAQGNLTSPWTVEVYDHADRLHEVEMKPGDVVYYESAKCLHGRNSPLAGGYYANIFTHYRPVGDPQWYQKENPEGTPEPLMDVGKCELVGKLGEYSVGAVKCENENIGPHLSPTMHTLKSGEDLYQWWLKVGPPFDDDKEEL